jgi:hypothetical protein
MENAAEMGSGAIVELLRFIKTGSAIQKLVAWRFCIIRKFG